MNRQNAERRLWFAIDTVGYGRLPAPETAKVQAALHEMLKTAADRAGLDIDKWDTQVSGDGRISAIPASEDEMWVVDVFVRQLSELLRQHNERFEQGAHLRLRLAIHQGLYEKGPNGWIGDAPKIVSRLEASLVLREAMRRNLSADMAVLLSDRVYKDIVAAGRSSLGEDLFAPVVAAGKPGEEPTPARLWIPLSSTPPRTRMPARAVRTVKVAAVVVLAVTALFIWLVLRDRGPTLPAASVHMLPAGPYERGATLTIGLVTARPVSAPTTRRVRLTVGDHVSDQVLCVSHTRVMVTVPGEGVHPARRELRDGDVLSVPLGAGTTRVDLQLSVTSDEGCEMDLGFDDVTPIS